MLSSLSTTITLKWTLQVVQGDRSEQDSGQRVLTLRLPPCTLVGMARESIGEFEQLVLLAILRLGDDAYGNLIHREIGQRTGRRVMRPAVYVALRRLEDKGLVSSSEGGKTKSRGRARRYFKVSKAGVSGLRNARQALAGMWSGIDELLEQE